MNKFSDWLKENTNHEYCETCGDYHDNTPEPTLDDIVDKHLSNGGTFNYTHGKIYATKKFSSSDIADSIHRWELKNNKKVPI